MSRELKTRTCSDTLQPVWDQVFDLPEFRPGDALDFTVFDEDVVKGGDVLGRASLSTDAITLFQGSDVDLSLNGASSRESATLVVRVVFPGSEADGFHPFGAERPRRRVGSACLKPNIGLEGPRLIPGAGGQDVVGPKLVPGGGCQTPRSPASPCSPGGWSSPMPSTPREKDGWRSPRSPLLRDWAPPSPTRGNDGWRSPSSPLLRDWVPSSPTRGNDAWRSPSSPKLQAQGLPRPAWPQQVTPVALQRGGDVLQVTISAARNLSGRGARGLSCICEQAGRPGCGVRTHVASGADQVTWGYQGELHGWEGGDLELRLEAAHSEVLGSCRLPAVQFSALGFSGWLTLCCPRRGITGLVEVRLTTGRSSSHPVRLSSAPLRHDPQGLARRLVTVV